MGCERKPEDYAMTRGRLQSALEVMQELFDESSDEDAAESAAIAVQALRLVLSLKELADA